MQQKIVVRIAVINHVLGGTAGGVVWLCVFVCCSFV